MRCIVLPLLRSLCLRRKGTGTSSLTPLRSKERSVTCQKKKDCDEYNISPFWTKCDYCLWCLTTLVLGFGLSEAWVFFLVEMWSPLRQKKPPKTIPSNSNLDILDWTLWKGRCVCLTEKACLCVWVCVVGHCSSVKINGKLQKGWMKTFGCNAYNLMSDSC